jgi:uncharacterized protein with HEPN domain
MSQHDDDLRMVHMLEHAKEAISMVQGRTRQDLDADRQLNLALVRLLEIVGEAAARVTSATRKAHPQIPWQQIAGLRNRLIHGYDEVDFDVLWAILIDDLPQLVDELLVLLRAK